MNKAWLHVLPRHSDEGGFGQRPQKQLHGRDEPVDLVVSADVVRQLHGVTGEPCLVHLEEHIAELETRAHCVATFIIATSMLSFSMITNMIV